MNTILKPADDSDNSSSSSNNNSNNNRPSDAIEIKGHNNNQKINGRGRSNDSGLGDDEESPTDNYQQWKKLATIAKELHGQQADSIPHMLVEMKKQIPNAPARRARRHALSSFDQLNEAERERLGKINPLHKSTYETKDSQELVKEYVYTAMVSKCRPRSSTVHETQASARRHSFPPDKRNRSRTASNFNEIQRRAFGNKPCWTDDADFIFQSHSLTIPDH